MELFDPDDGMWLTPAPIRIRPTNGDDLEARVFLDADFHGALIQIPVAECSVRACSARKGGTADPHPRTAAQAGSSRRGNGVAPAADGIPTAVRTAAVADVRAVPSEGKDTPGHAMPEERSHLDAVQAAPAQQRVSTDSERMLQAMSSGTHGRPASKAGCCKVCHKLIEHGTICTSGQPDCQAVQRSLRELYGCASRLPYSAAELSEAVRAKVPAFWTSPLWQPSQRNRRLQRYQALFSNLYTEAVPHGATAAHPLPQLRPALSAVASAEAVEVDDGAVPADAGTSQAATAPGVAGTDNGGCADGTDVNLEGSLPQKAVKRQRLAADTEHKCRWCKRLHTDDGAQRAKPRWCRTCLRQYKKLNRRTLGRPLVWSAAALQALADRKDSAFWASEAWTSGGDAALAALCETEEFMTPGVIFARAQESTPAGAVGAPTAAAQQEHGVADGTGLGQDL